MARGVPLADIHPVFEARANDQDLDGLMELYEPDATMVLMDGSTVTGTAAIREELAAILALQGRMTLRGRYVVEAGDLALLSNEWTLVAGDRTMSAVTHEVARRQPDGSWRYVLDHPFAGLGAAQPAPAASAPAGGPDPAEWAD
jgi:ketosteroid isomerase-like protein